MRPKYADLYFGKSDSRNEASEDHDAFVKSYVDLNGAIEAVLGGGAFLVLGPKGTGKSALAWYVNASQPEGSHLSLVRDASSLPLAEIPRLQTGQEAGPERTVVAWKFILLCNYLEILVADPDCSLQFDREVTRVTKLLRDFGFMGDASGRALLKASSTTITIPIPKMGPLYKRESRPELNIYNLLPYMEQWAETAYSEKRHVLMLDGLDSIFLNDKKYDESLSSLVQAAYSINQRLQAADASGSVVLLLRNDVFARIALSLPDSQKMRDDLAFDLDWRVMSGKAGARAPLIQLVNKKAGRALGAYVDVLSYFPKRIVVGTRGESPRNFQPLQYLLNLTRHTPRDLLRLFDEIRKVERSGIYDSSGATLAPEVIREGVVQYATKYFVGAIRNEFAGYEGGPESASAAITALKSIGRQTFDKNEFVSALSADSPTLVPSADRLLTLLFYAGAIGNVVGTTGQSYMQFYHRRDESEIYLRGKLMLHNALLHAWSIPHTI